MSTPEPTEPQLSIAAKLRKLADFVDAHPVLEQFPELFSSFGYFSRHYVGDEAAKLDVFAEAFNATIVHRVHGPKAVMQGRFSHIWVDIDGLIFRPQAPTEDYEQATGKTVPLPDESSSDGA